MADDGKAEVAVFDPEKLKKDLQARVRNQFLEVIPDEQWDAMIEKEIKGFFENESDLTIEEQEREKTNEYGHGYGYKSTFDRLKVKGTAFRALVYDALVPLVKERLGKALSEDQFKIHFQTGWKEWIDSQGLSQPNQVTEVEYLGLFMKEQLEKMVPAMVTQMFQGIFAGAAHAVSDAIMKGDPSFIPPR